MADMTMTLEGRVAVSTVEGPHYELTVEDPAEASRTRYVLIPVGDEITRVLQTCQGKDVRVTGYVLEGASVFMRGVLFRVIEVSET